MFVDTIFIQASVISKENEPKRTNINITIFGGHYWILTFLIQIKTRRDYAYMCIERRGEDIVRYLLA